MVLYLSHMTISHFRSHKLARVDVDARPVAIYGPNGAGKTNILEAISLLSPGRGLRRFVGRDSALASEAMTVGVARYVDEFGPMEPHNHAEETVYVLGADRGWVRWGPDPDDLPNRIDLEPGVLRIRPHGGAGGHRGVQSIVDELGTDRFPRLRVGVGRPRTDAARHVLERLSERERTEAEITVAEAAEALAWWLDEGDLERYRRLPNPDWLDGNCVGHGQTDLDIAVLGVGKGEDLFADTHRAANPVIDVVQDGDAVAGGGDANPLQ